MSQPLIATRYFQPRASVTESARALASVGTPMLLRGEKVSVSFVGLRGVSSAYFNALLLIWRESVGAAVVQQLVTFITESPAQKTILDRSVQAVLGSSTHGSPGPSNPGP